MRRFAIILGAGASHGALGTKKRPPLDTDFLATARRVLCKSGRRDLGAVAWGDLREALEAAGLRESDVIKGRLEHLSTYLEARVNMPGIQHGAGRPADYAKALTALLRVICFTLVRTGGTEACPLHRALFELVEPSCVLTFNYDLIADQSIQALNRLSWYGKSYCGSSISVNAATQKRYLRPPPIKRLRNVIPLMKLHGSIHWQAHKRGGGFNLWLDEIPDASLIYSTPPDRPLVVPPVAAKMTIQKGSLRRFWSQAAKHLREAPGWIIWGYSFPKTDTVTHMLCREALTSNRRPKPVIVINPDPGVAENVKASLRKIRVLHWVSVERFLLDHHKLKLP